MISEIYSNILAKKRNINVTGKDGQINQITDLTESTCKFSNIFSVNQIESSEDYIARPDLISMTMYDGELGLWDYVCKYSGISNPLELNEDTILFLPTIEEIGKSMRTKNDIPDTPTKKEQLAQGIITTTFNKNENKTKPSSVISQARVPFTISVDGKKVIY